MPSDTIQSEDQIRRSVEDVLASGEYRIGERKETEQSFGWWDSFWEWVGSLFGGSGGPETTSSAAAPWVKFLIVGIMAAVVIALLVAVIRLWIGKRRKSAAIPKVDESRLPNKPEELESLANEAAGRESFVEAIRLLLRAATLRIASGEKRVFRPGISNREILRRYRGTKVFDPLQLLVHSVNEKWFGERGCTSLDYADCQGSYEAIKSHVSGMRRAGPMLTGQ